MTTVFPFPVQRSGGRRNARTVYFSRQELFRLLALYSERVARGEWRDYAIDHGSGQAVFSVFRHTHEAPQFSIIKRGSQPKRPGSYHVFSGRREVSRAATIEDVLKVFEKQLRVVS